MTRHSFSRRSHKSGLDPGALIHVGEVKTEKVAFHVLDYSPDAVKTDRAADAIEECLTTREPGTMAWIDIVGLNDVGSIEKVCNFLGVHPLIQEDILNTAQRPKLEDFDSYLYLVMKVLSWDEAANDMRVEQVSLLLAKGVVVTFQEAERGVFNPVADRIRSNKGKLRKMGADYLAYALLDAVVDNYFTVLERLGDQIEELEEVMVHDTDNRVLREIHRFKRDMIQLRKSVWPAREVMSALYRGESDLFQQTTLIYLKDVSDHVIQMIDTIESYRDTVSGLLDFYISNVNNKMNEVMKVLTVISTIFIPITFIASIYGMNFDGMVELHWPQAYHIALVLMAAIGLSLFWVFKRKKWI
ncbi:MAG: magnesium/cobalt transporter CorA [Planctomycetota bacterium]